MTLQRNSSAGEQLQNRNAVYTLFVELAEITDLLTEKTTDNDFEELQPLIQRREMCVRQISEAHSKVCNNAATTGVDDEQMKEILSRVKQSSERMQSVMEEKSKAIVTKLANLQNQKMYQQ